MDREPQIRGWLALAILALLVGLLLGATLGASRDEPEKAVSTPEAPVPVAPPPPVAEVPAAPPVLKRADILTAVSRAASNYSAGLDYSAEQAALVGRRFELISPFACEGPTSNLSLDPAQIAVDAKAKTLVFTAQPRDWTRTGWIKEIVGEDEVEVAEGFWIPRPWQLSEDCPRARPVTPGEPPPTLAPPSVGLVQVLRSDDSRLASRADRPFRLVERASDEELQSREVAAKLLLSGRLASFPAGQVIRCRSSSVDQWPVCLVGMQLDRVAFLSLTGEVMAEWSLPAPAAGTPGKVAAPGAEPTGAKAR